MTSDPSIETIDQVKQQISQKEQEISKLNHCISAEIVRNGELNVEIQQLSKRVTDLLTAKRKAQEINGRRRVVEIPQITDELLEIRNRTNRVWQRLSGLADNACTSSDVPTGSTHSLGPALTWSARLTCVLLFLLI